MNKQTNQQTDHCMTSRHLTNVPCNNCSGGSYLKATLITGGSEETWISVQDTKTGG